MKTDTPTRFMRRREAAEYLRSRGVFIAPATLAKLACTGGGPAFQHAGRFPIYTADQLDAWALARLSRLVRSTTEADALRQAHQDGRDMAGEP